VGEPSSVFLWDVVHRCLLDLEWGLDGDAGKVASSTTRVGHGGGEGSRSDPESMFI
jgi:hypothetical protein